MEIKDFVVTEPGEFKFTFDWLVKLFERIFGDIFGWLVETEGWDK